VKAIKKHQLERRLDRDAITDAVDTGILTEAEAAVLRLADQATDRAIKVDDFDPEELVPRQLSRDPDRVESAAE
jgi:acyl-CoA dehydrogenase